MAAPISTLAVLAEKGLDIRMLRQVVHSIAQRSKELDVSRRLHVHFIRSAVAHALRTRHRMVSATIASVLAQATAADARER